MVRHRNRDLALNVQSIWEMLKKKQSFIEKTKKNPYKDLAKFFKSINKIFGHALGKIHEASLRSSFIFFIGFSVC